MNSLAIVPACGASVRMQGVTKLLLPLNGVSLIRRVVEALLGGGADRVIVVTTVESALRNADRIASEASQAGAEIVRLAERPLDMRATVEGGLGIISARATHLVLTPGDSPGLTACAVEKLLAIAKRRSQSIVVASHNGKRGHPLVLPWDIASRISSLPQGIGINGLVDQLNEMVEMAEVEESGILGDLDTPEHYRAWEAANAADLSCGGSGL